MSRSIQFLLAGLLLTTPSTWAGTADEPETTDPAGDVTDERAGPWADMLAAWFQFDDGELTVHWRVASLDDLHPSACWNLDFLVNDDEWQLFVMNNGGELQATTRAYHGRAPGTIIQWQESPPGVYPERGFEHEYIYGLSEPTILPGSTTELVVAFDAGLFQVPAAASITFLRPWSCIGNFQDRIDEMPLGNAFKPDGDAWQPPASNAVYEGFVISPMAAWTVDNFCNGPDFEELGAVCRPIAEADRGHAYTLWSGDIAATSLESWACFFDETGYNITCEWPLENEWRIPRYATHFTVYIYDARPTTWTLTLT